MSDEVSAGDGERVFQAEVLGYCSSRPPADTSVSSGDDPSGPSYVAVRHGRVVGIGSFPSPAEAVRTREVGSLHRPKSRTGTRLAAGSEL